MIALLQFSLLCVVFSNVYSWNYMHQRRTQEQYLDFGLTDDSRNFTRWFTQDLDHFDMSNSNTWQQKYFVNDDYFDQEKRNVAFLMIGGEGSAWDGWMTQGAWIGNAKDSNAILFQLEHRFYGESHPTEDLSVDNLKYLTSEQALADIALFIDVANGEYNLSADVKWIVFGGSYSGTLAAWARLKYPHLIQGAVSTSGPLLAIANFEDYYSTITNDLGQISEDCPTNVKAGMAQIELRLQSETGQKEVTEIMRLCDPIEERANDANEVSNLIDILAGNFAGIAQYNKDNRLSTRGTLLGNITLDTICEIMTTSDEPIQQLANFNSLMLEAYNGSCLAYGYAEMINVTKVSSWDDQWTDGGRQWFFQTCNEFGFYQTSDKAPQIFGSQFPLDFFVQQCTEVFGPEFDLAHLKKGTDRINTMFGGLDIEVTNVVFTHGSVDPWHTLGVTETKSENAPAIFITGTAHCADMYPPDENDLPALTAARVEIARLIRTWLDM